MKILIIHIYLTLNNLELTLRIENIQGIATTQTLKRDISRGSLLPGSD